MQGIPMPIRKRSGILLLLWNDIPTVCFQNILILCNYSLVILIYEKQDKTGYYNHYEFFWSGFYSSKSGKYKITKGHNDEIMCP